MTTEVDNVDDLEALLAGLEDDDGLNDLEGLEDEAPAPVVEKPARKPRAPAKPKAEPEPVAETYEGLEDADLEGLEDEPTTPKVAPVTDEDVEDADLVGIEDDLTEAAPAKPVAKAVEQEDPLELADKIIALSQELTVAAVKHSDLTEEEVSDRLNAVISTISAGDKFADIAKQMRDAVIKPDDEPFEVDEVAETVAIKDAVVEPDSAGDEEVPAPTAVEGDDDAEMEALLAASVDESADLATATAAPAGTAKSITPKTIRPVFNPSGDLKTFIDPDRLQDDLNFSTNNISLAMTRQAALFAHYSNLSAQAAYQHDRAKQQVELLEANLDNKFRDSLTMAGTKFTETSLKSLITKDSSYQAAVTRAHEARAIAKMVDTAADSFRHRKDMLIQVGADLREEKKGNLVMKEHPGQAATRVMKGE
ncbi:hypothetical protein hairong_057 [Pseudomonas phage hairong]|nr:hypothetical protein hairong_057 [Pseudomonas phage hairong]